MTDDIFDFGFTAVTEEELQTVETSRTIAQEAQSEVEELDKRLTMLYNAIIPLLDNLRKDPEKDYIYWPDRTGKIDAFETKLANIVNGDY